jgi:hypothetical protein
VFVARVSRFHRLEKKLLGMEFARKPLVSRAERMYNTQQGLIVSAGPFTP